MTENEWAIAGAAAFAISAGIFGALSFISAVNWRESWPARFLVAAAATAGLWSAASAYALMSDIRFLAVALVADALRIAAWVGLLVAILTIMAGKSQILRRRAAAITAAGIAFAAIVGVQASLAGPTLFQGAESGYQIALALEFLAAAVVGLVLIENILRNSDADAFWRHKFILFGIGGAFAVDVAIAADAALFQRFDAGLYAMRGVAAALAAPLVFISVKRATEWAPKIHVSRQITFYSAALLFVGGYLLVIAGAGYYTRLVGGRWGEVLGFAFLFAGAMALLAIVTSGRFRAQIKRFISQNFYSSAYDYGQEWRAFVDRIEGAGDDVELGERVLHSVADVFEVPNAQLWVRVEDAYVAHAAWNRPFADVELRPNDELARRLEDGSDFVLMEDCFGDAPPDWLASFERPWIAAPLKRRERTIGFMLLSEPRAPHPLTEEDAALLSMVVRQAGSYLAEGLMQKELSQARQFAAFNQRIAYVAHDLKNIVSQLTLMTSNAHKHKDNPEFVSDMIETIENSLKTMRRMLGDIKQAHAADLVAGDATRVQTFDVAPVLGEVVAHVRASGLAQPLLRVADKNLVVSVDPDRFAAAVRNLVQNACDAANGGTGGASVKLTALRENGFAVIEVIDKSGGMSPDFIREELFKPFRSTKDGGYGLGAFECREFAKGAGGRLEVDSTLGDGTTMRLFIPLSDGTASAP